MRIQFTKRSEKDKDLVTLPLAQLDGTDLDFGHRACFIGDEVVLVIEGIPTLFTLSRPNSLGEPTAATSRNFPRRLRLPRIGRPVYADVSEIR